MTKEELNKSPDAPEDISIEWNDKAAIPKLYGTSYLPQRHLELIEAIDRDTREMTREEWFDHVNYSTNVHELIDTTEELINCYPLWPPEFLKEFQLQRYPNGKPRIGKREQGLTVIRLNRELYNDYLDRLPGDEAQGLEQFVEECLLGNKWAELLSRGFPFIYEVTAGYEG